MIQRIQSIWLLVAAACGFAMSKFPLFSAVLPDTSVRKYFATESLLFFALTMGVACLALVCIFLYKNRRTQYRLAVVGALLSVVVIGLQVWQVEAFKTATAMVKGTYMVGGLLPIAMFIFFVLAAGRIRKDEKLVKSLERLR